MLDPSKVIGSVVCLVLMSLACVTAVALTDGEVDLWSILLSLLLYCGGVALVFSLVAAPWGEEE